MLTGSTALDAADPRKRWVASIRGVLERASALTRQLLAFSRRRPFEPTVVELNALLPPLLTLLRPLLGRSVEIETDLDPDLARLRADVGQIEQIVMNLAVNARDAMPEGGRLTLATANVELDEAFVRGHPGLAPGPYVTLLVRDTGAGMTPDVRARIFEPFFTTKGVGQGTGLGLSTVYGIVTRHHGAVTVESEPGLGTTFRIFFPRADEGSEAAAPAEALPAERPGSPTILIVDAERGIVDFMEVVLDEQGYRVLTAATSAAALALAASERGPIDLVIADLRLPDLAGRELVERLRATRPRLRALYTSAYSREEIEQAIAHPIEAPLLTKPFGVVDLSRWVAELITWGA